MKSWRIVSCFPSADSQLIQTVPNFEVRVIGGVTGWENLGIHADEAIVWACLTFSIPSADLVLQWQ